MRNKLFFVVCSIFLLSGCTANYRLDIDDMGIVEEKVTLVEKNSKLLTYTLDVEEYLDNILTDVKDDKRFYSYSLSAENGGSESLGTGTRTYVDLENYKKNSIIITEMFKDISITNTNGLIQIIMSPNTNFKYFEDTTQDSSILDEVNIEISVPFQVKSSNADNITGNIYSWNILKGNNLKTISITYDTNNKTKRKLNNSEIILLGMGLLLVSFVTYVFIKYKSNNK